MNRLNKTIKLLLLSAPLLFLSLTALGYELHDSSKNKITQNEDTQFLQKMSHGISHIANQTNKALVFVSVSKTLKSPYGTIDPFEFFFGPGQGGRSSPQREKPRQEGLGSGFIVDLENGYVITNNHVIDGADEITLKLANDKTYPAKVLGRDKNTDVAVVQITEKNFDRKGLQELVLDNSERLKVGDFVLALGAPFGLESSLSFGVISALGRGSLEITNFGDFIQTDAAINPGNSGGPLIGMDGRVIGMNTAIYSRSGSSAGIGFAVPANLVRRVATQLINGGSFNRGFIGVSMQDLNDEFREAFDLPKDAHGIIVGQVVNDGPAGKAGIQPGDIIYEVADKDVKKPSDLANIIGLKNPGEKVLVKYYRDGKSKSSSIKVGSWENEDNSSGNQATPEEKEAPFGLSLVPNTSDTRKKYDASRKNGAFISEVEPNSPAARAGLREGDLILTANGKKISNVGDALKALQDTNRALIRIERNSNFFFVSLRK